MGLSFTPAIPFRDVPWGSIPFNALNILAMGPGSSDDRPTGAHYTIRVSRDVNYFTYWYQAIGDLGVSR